MQAWSIVPISVNHSCSQGAWYDISMDHGWMSHRAWHPWKARFDQVCNPQLHVPAYCIVHATYRHEVSRLFHRPWLHHIARHGIPPQSSYSSASNVGVVKRDCISYLEASFDSNTSACFWWCLWITRFPCSHQFTITSTRYRPPYAFFLLVQFFTSTTTGLTESISSLPTSPT